MARVSRRGAVRGRGWFSGFVTEETHVDNLHNIGLWKGLKWKARRDWL